MKKKQPRCVAPMGDVADDETYKGLICGAPATTTREAGGLVCPLCDIHALEIDADRAREALEGDGYVG